MDFAISPSKSELKNSNLISFSLLCESVFSSLNLEEDQDMEPKKK